MRIDVDDITFRPHRLGYFIKLALILGGGAGFVKLGYTLHPAWFGGVALAIYLGAALASRFHTGWLSLRGFDLVLYLGAFANREVSYPLWRVQIEIRQTLIGRMFNVGTVIVHVGDERTRCRIALLRTFRRLVAERKLQLLAMAGRHTDHLQLL